MTIKDVRVKPIQNGVTIHYLWKETENSGAILPRLPRRRMINTKTCTTYNGL